MQIVYNKNVKALGDCCVSAKNVENVHLFHEGLEGYAPTPLVSLPALAEKTGVAEFLVKDESKRFGLNAFKALGGSYAIAKIICEKLNLELGRDTFRALQSGEFDAELKRMTFITATDGNHGRGVAWTAKMLGCKAVVYLPEGSAEERLNNILALGAEAEITSMNYDDTVRYAERIAREKGWVLVQDTSWDGYEDIPAAIMKGYTTMGYEINMQLRGREKPTHLFLQAGVGSMAGAIAGYFASLWKENCPKIIIVEPDKADCIFRTAKADDGTIHTVTGSMDSMMAGLCCGEPCTLGWDILKNVATAFISCDDSYAAHGMRILGKPLGNDPVIISGESGAVTAGVAVKVCENAEKKAELGIDENSRILVISTEGDTDRENYKRILSEAYKGE